MYKTTQYYAKSRQLLQGADAAGLECALPKGRVTVNLSFSEFSEIVKGHSRPLLVPLFAELPVPAVSAFALYEHVRSGPSCILESVEGNEKIARYSCIGLDPVLSVVLDGTVRITGDAARLCPAGFGTGPVVPAHALRDILGKITVADIPVPRYFGGFIGCFSYDIIESFHPNQFPGGLRGKESADPPGQFMLFRDCIVFDHCAGKLYIIANALLTETDDPARVYSESLEKINRRMIEIAAFGKGDKKPEAGMVPAPDRTGTSALQLASNLSKEEFMQAVTRVKDYIAAGEIFQAVISRRIDCRVGCSPLSVYRELRRINPSPYLYYIDFGEKQVIGASPELLVRVEKGKITTVPIAGTRGRGLTPAEDEALAAELLADEKERAEHTMLVDLARNDVGRISRFGTVRVEGFMSVEKFSHVQHIVSTVEGDLDPAYDAFDAFASCFPAGTVSGAPKIRAMQIIDELEPDRRGFYAGATGYIGFDGMLEVAITIRTIVMAGGKASVQVGAGIVADSVAENEWNETERKGRAMLAAIEAAEGLR